MRISIFSLLYCISFIGISFANSSNKNWEITHRLIKEANAIDRQWLDKATGKGMNDSAKSESRRAWEKVKAHLESLSLDELIETASSAAEHVAHRTELTDDWEREAAATSDVEFILSLFYLKNPEPSDIDALLLRIRNDQESAYFRVALFSWFRNQVIQERLPAIGSNHVKNGVIQVSYDILSNAQPPETVWGAALNAYCDIIIYDILSICKTNEALRPYLRDPEAKPQLFEHLRNGKIAVPDEVKTQLTDRNKDLSRLTEILGKNLTNDQSPCIKSTIIYVLRKLSAIPVGATEQRELERLQSEFSMKEQ